MKQKDNAGVIGQYRFKTSRACLKCLLPEDREKCIHKIGGKYRPFLRTTPWIKNLIVSNTDNGINLIIQRLIGLKVYDIEITSAEIGTGSSIVTDADTDLDVPVTTGISRALESASTDTALIQFFIPDGSLPNDTYNEFGLRCGTKLFARSLISPAYTKASNEDTSVEYQIIISN